MMNIQKKGHNLKYSRKVINHTPGTLHTIPPEVLNLLEKLTFRKKPIFIPKGKTIYILITLIPSARWVYHHQFLQNGKTMERSG